MFLVEYPRLTLSMSAHRSALQFLHWSMYISLVSSLEGSVHEEGSTVEGAVYHEEIKSI